MTAKEEVLETIRLWIEIQRQWAATWDDSDAGYLYALQDLTDLMGSL